MNWITMYISVNLIHYRGHEQPWCSSTNTVKIRPLSFGCPRTLCRISAYQCPLWDIWAVDPYVVTLLCFTPWSFRISSPGIVIGSTRPPVEVESSSGYSGRQPLVLGWILSCLSSRTTELSILNFVKKNNKLWFLIRNKKISNNSSYCFVRSYWYFVWI